MWVHSGRKPFFIAAILTALLVPSPVRAEETAGTVEMTVFAGFFDVANSGPPLEVGFEMRWSTAVENLEILAGVAATEDESAWVYGGARYDLLRRSQRWLLAPGFAVALYEQGDGKDLGQTLEFRSSIELARRISERLRIGLNFYHLSNASMADDNPGANSLVVTLGFRRHKGAGSADG